MAQEFQHYQASFSIFSDPGSESDIYTKLQNLVYKWVLGKEGRRRKDFQRQDYGFLFLLAFLERDRRSPEPPSISPRLAILNPATPGLWSTRTMTEKKKGVTWTTKIGLRQFAGEGRVAVSVLLVYSISAELALTGDVALPTPTIPWFVRKIFENYSTFKITCGGFPLNTGEHPKVVASPADAEQVAAFIDNPARSISVVLIVGKSSDAEDEAKKLGYALQGKSCVFIIPYDYRLLKPFKKYRVEFRQCRILLPFGRFGNRLSTHMVYSLDKPENATAAYERTVRSQLGYYSVFESGCVTSVADIRNLIRKETFQKLQKDLEGKTKDLQANEKWKEFADNVMQQYEAESKKCEELLRQIEDQKLRNLELEDEKAELEKAKNEEIFNLRASYEAKGRKVHEASFKTPPELPETIEVVRDWALSGAFPHLAFSASAWKPALQYENFSDLGNLWKILWHLDNTLFKMKFIDNVSNLEKAFEDKSGIRYSRSEGKNTANDARLAALRRFQFEGREYEMWTHVGLGTREPHMIRVYFAFDDDSRRIIIGYVGPHMDNATTKAIH